MHTLSFLKKNVEAYNLATLLSFNAPDDERPESGIPYSSLDIRSNVSMHDAINELLKRICIFFKAQQASC